jgi:hypothetical protein
MKVTVTVCVEVSKEKPTQGDEKKSYLRYARLCKKKFLVFMIIVM